MITPRGRLAFASPSIALCRRILATADVEILTLVVQPVNLKLSFPDLPHERSSRTGTPASTPKSGTSTTPLARLT